MPHTSATAKALAEVHDRDGSPKDEAAAYALGAYKKFAADGTEEGGDGGSSGSSSVAMDTSAAAGQPSPPAGGGSASSGGGGGSGTGYTPEIDDSLYSRQRYVLVSPL
jgi:hypothetical protein